MRREPLRSGAETARHESRGIFEVAPSPTPCERTAALVCTNSELIADLEAILHELRKRLDNYLELAANDLIAAVEGFNFAGQLQATLNDAREHATRTRERLDEIQRPQP
jgi:hypothetical protein